MAAVTWRVLLGDVRETLETLPAESVQTCVTSPPYWGLRDYGTGVWAGGNPVCGHQVSGASPDPKNPDSTARNGKPSAADRSILAGSCPCGATRIDSQIGLEATPDAYVTEMLAVFREVRRVLKDDGTLWLNLGDSYASGTKGSGGRGDSSGLRRDGRDEASRLRSAATTIGHQLFEIRRVDHGLKPKDLVGIPWMVAFALRADGWYLRSDIIWAKPNPMPESVTDRPTKAHEYIFLLSKSPRYYYDAAAIAEQGADASAERYKSAFGGAKARAVVGDAGIDTRTRPQGMREYDGTRNKRSVWTVPTQPYAGAHFATFPEDLITPCILAGSAHGGTVLDPFTGSGTTGVVAIRHQRSFVGCELNPSYLEMARTRIGNVAPMFSTEVRL